MADEPKNTGDPEPSEAQTADAAILARAHASYTLCVSAEGDLRERMLDDYKFCDEDYGQWPARIKSERDADQRPCIQSDRLSGPIRQILNQIRESRPAVLVRPVDDQADVDKAEVRQGIIRAIETDSMADVAYLTAAEHQIKIGRGWWRIVTEWDEVQPYQHIRIVPIENPFSVYYDPRCKRPDYSDARFAFILEDLEPEDYRKRFGGEPPSGLSEFRATGDAAPDWFPKGKVRIAEYFDVTVDYQDIARPDGTTDKREVRKVTWYLISATAILDRRAIPGPYIPIIPVIGERTNIDGVIDLKGIVRRAKDPQRMVNYERSATVETVALAPRAPFIAAFGQIEAYKQVWDSANHRNWSVLPYDPQHVAGSLVPPPQRTFGEPPIQAMTMLAREFENDLRAATGFFDVQGQEQRPEQSGKAIVARQRQAEMGNSHFLDNLGRAIRLTGLILNAWIPVYYDTPRTLHIVGKDNQERDVTVHAGHPPPMPMPGQPPQMPMQPPMMGGRGQMQGQQPPKPPEVVDLRVGRYDITVSMGPSAQTKRVEAVEQMTLLFQAAPQLLPLIGDLYFKNMDWPEAQQIAERMKKTLPPNLQDQQGQPEIPPQVQQQMQALKQQHELLTKAVEELTREKEMGAQKLQAEFQVKQAELQMERQTALEQAQVEIEKARIQAETAIQKAHIEAETKRQIAQMEARLDREKHARDLQQQADMSDADREQAVALAAAKGAD